MKTCFHFLILGLAALPFQSHAQTHLPGAATNAESAAMVIASAAVETNSTVTAAAVTATNLPAGTNSVAGKNDIDIHSDRGIFKQHEVIYIGNVRVVSPQMNMTCERMTATSTNGGSRRPDHIVAETNVVIDALDSRGKPVHATADLAIYDYKVTSTSTNDTIELHGNAHVESSIGPTTGDPIIWDRVNDTVKASNLHTIIHETESKPIVPAGPKPRTNAPPPLVPEKKNLEKK